jgi:hypothetical protein
MNGTEESLGIFTFPNLVNLVDREDVHQEIMTPWPKVPY